MTGVLLHGLRMYDQAQPREDVRQALRANCDFLWRETYIPQDRGFIYAQCSQFWNKGSTWTISLVGDGLAYGCRLDPERAHLEELKTAVAANFHTAPVGRFGKSFSQGTCFYPYLLHDLKQLGLTNLVP